MQADLLDPEALAQAMQGCEAVIHLAGKVSRDKQMAGAMHEVHVGGTRSLLAAMKQVGLRKLVVSSTSGTVGMAKDAPWTPATEAQTPDFDLLGRFPYYTSKLYQEQALARAADDVDAIILNPSLLLGPGDVRMSSTEDVLDILEGRVPAVSEGTVALVDVRDAAPAFIAALERGRAGERYLLNGANLSLRNFAQRVAVAGNIRGPAIKLSGKWAVRGAKLLSGVFETLDRDAPLDPVSVELGTLHWSVDASKATEELGFSARDPQVTIEATVRDLVDRGMFRRPR